MTILFEFEAKPGRARRRCVPFYAATSLTLLKPWLKKALWPVAATLVRAGATANQVTFASLAGSIAVGWLLCTHSGETTLFVLLPGWLVIRTACAAIDGTMAVELNQKSRLGSFLNEAGDIASDAALFFPLASVAPFSRSAVGFLICLAALSEIAGIAGSFLGGGRRLDGPLGKGRSFYRSIVLMVLGVTIALFGGLPPLTSLVTPVLGAGLVLTIWNRLRYALTGRPGRARTR
jgi:CDP-diacylglycerol---glycerol-3-phosphate 3-phosphatidyltransferase